MSYYIGKTIPAAKEAYIGTPQDNNGFILITGESGSGKSITLENLKAQALECGDCILAFDFSGTLKADCIVTPSLRKHVDNIRHIDAKNHGLPMNLFQQRKLENGVYEEGITDCADRIATIISSVYGFGEQQRHELFECCMMGITGDWIISPDIECVKDTTTYGKNSIPYMSLGTLIYILNCRKKISSYACTIVGRLMELYESGVFTNDEYLTWDNILSLNHHMVVFQLADLPLYNQKLIAELLLADLWHYTKLRGPSIKKFIVVIDEFQNLSMKQGMTMVKILTEGRKFGWNMWLATQTFERFKDEEVSYLQQASTKLFFRPPQNELLKVARLISYKDPMSVYEQLGRLKKGECVALGRFMNKNQVVSRYCHLPIQIPFNIGR